jgi:hypothetical protein
MMEEPYIFFNKLLHETDIKIEQLARYDEMPQVLFSLENDYPFSCEFWFFSVLRETDLFSHDNNSIQKLINEYCYEELIQTKINIFNHFYQIAVNDFILYLKENVNGICAVITGFNIFYINYTTINVEIYDGKFIFYLSLDGIYLDSTPYKKVYKYDINHFQTPREQYRTKIRMIMMMPDKEENHVSNEFKSILDFYPSDDESSIFGKEYRKSKQNFVSTMRSGYESLNL